MTKANMMYMLLNRISGVLGSSIFSAYRLKKVTLYLGPAITAVGEAPFIGRQASLQWATGSAGTADVDSKPDMKIPQVVDGSHSSSVSIVPNPKSVMGFWEDDPDGSAPLFTVRGPPATGQSQLLVLDISADYTLCDWSSPSVNVVTSTFVATMASPGITGTGSSSMVPVGWETYT